MSDREKEMVSTCAKMVMAVVVTLRRMGLSRSEARRIVSLSVGYAFEDEVLP
jgi:hypothetical protein